VPLLSARYLHFLFLFRMGYSPRSSGVLHTVGIDLQLTMRHSADISSATISLTPDGLASRQTDGTEPISSSDHIRCARRLETLAPPYSYVGRQFVPGWTPRTERLIIPSFVRLNFREYAVSARFRWMLKATVSTGHRAAPVSCPGLLSVRRIMHQGSFHRVSSSRFGLEVPFPSIQNLYFVPERKPVQ
jgi:hypothetical protein